MGTFRLFRGELKKILLGPGIFIMSGLLILVLAIAPQFFTPNTKEDTSTLIITGETVGERYTDFTEKYLTDENGSYKYAEIVSNAKNINELITLEKSPSENLKDKFMSLEASRQVFSGSINNTTIDESEIPSIQAQLQTFLGHLNTTKTTYLGYINKNIPELLITKESETDLLFALNNCIAKVEQYIAKDTIAELKELDTLLTTNNYTTIIKNVINNEIKDLSFDKTSLQTLYNDYYITASVKLNTIFNETRVFAINNVSSSDAKDINQINDYIYNYLGQANNINNILKYGTLNIISKTLSDAELSSYKGEVFTGFNSYEVNEKLVKYQYLYRNNQSDSDFANIFAFNYSSNLKTNAYDYMYFVMEIMSFLIITYSVILAANMIAGEQSSGTMKMLAIRPYKRYKIMFAKIMATLFFALIFMLVTAVVSLITGLIIYDLNSLPILAVFNAKYVFTISAPILYLIYFACVFIKIWIFVMIAFTISTIFRNGIVSTIVSVVLYFVTMVLTFVASGANWIKYVPTANFDLFKYFGGSFILKSGTGQALTNLFISPVFTDTTVLYSGLLVGILMIVLHILTYAFFIKKDIT